jgi:hypothetical protein
MELNKSNLKKIRGIIVFTAIVIACFWKYDVVFAILKFAFGILFPFILGGAIAFILNVPMNFIERHLFPEKKKEKPDKDSGIYAYGRSGPGRACTGARTSPLWTDPSKHAVYLCSSGSGSSPCCSTGNAGFADLWQFYESDVDGRGNCGFG